MLNRIIFAAVLFTAVSARASLNTSNHLALGLGSSIAKGSLDYGYYDKVGPSRNGRGETIVLKFRSAKHITGIRLTALSNKKNGQVLIRDARGRFSDGVKTIETAFVDLFQYNKSVSNGCSDYRGLCLLSHSGSSSATPNDKFQEVEFRVEGFEREDATLLLELDSADGFLYQDFLLKRTGDSAYDGMLGAFLDEANYGDLNSRELRTLMRFAAQPALADLVDHTFVCSVFPKNRAPRTDFKTRHYFSPAPGTLQSTTDKDPTVHTWILTQQGWKLPARLRTGCGNVLHATVLRLTATGNLIAEFNVDREDYIQACVDMGYDRWSAEQGLEEGTYHSIISREYRTGAYEFCRPMH